MQDLLEKSLEGGRIIDVIFGFMAIECFALLALNRFTQRGLKSIEILALMLPGICLLLALRSALENESRFILVAWLLAALIAHLGDLKMRLKNSLKGSPSDTLAVSRSQSDGTMRKLAR
ncbi:hypothetical protein [Hyphomicrobium sp.]|jgi:hypothetical protein|uniref:hypothetical protein n=1 Tax=Hyphomicrobium sp. TaxID=82 RepID=UPI00356148A9